MERLDEFLDALLHCDTVKVILTGCGESVFETKEIYEAICDIHNENAELKARLEKAVELPCNVGDTVYRKGRFSDRIVEAEVKQIVKSKFGLTFKAARGDNTYFSFDEEVIGERIFLAEAEAQAKLDEMKGGAE